MNPPRNPSNPASRENAAQAVKPVHRRSKTGCFTCRERRVKCDEGRPVCSQEECRNVQRECGYSILIRPSSTTSKQQDTPLKRRVSTAQVETAPSRGDNLTLSAKKSSTWWSRLSNQEKSHFEYFERNITFHYYGFRADPDGFFTIHLPRIALNAEHSALVYSLVAFAAYHSTFATNRKRPLEFLYYYNKAIVSLQEALGKGCRTVTILMTVLQLATLEQNFGDWQSSISHQRAARSILFDTYNEQTVLADYTSRMTLGWLIYLDILGAVIGGVAPQIPQAWYTSYCDFYQQAFDRNSSDLVAMFDFYRTQALRIMVNTQFTVGANNTGSLKPKDFEAQVDKHLESLEKTKILLEGAFRGHSNFFRLPSKKLPPGDEVFDFRDEDVVFDEALFPMNLVLSLFWSAEIGFKAYVSATLPIRSKDLAPELVQAATKICKMFQGLEHRQMVALRVIGNNMAGAALFLGGNKQEIDWFCRKLALLERLGFVCAIKWRHRLSKLWARDLVYWWLPNEDPPETILALRELVEKREIRDEDVTSQEISEISGLFSVIQLGK